MSSDAWRAEDRLVRLFQAVGRALLRMDMEDSHSGNIAMRWRNPAGREFLLITSTGSQKGDLDAEQICFLSTEETDSGYYKASSETDIHARILSLEGVGASIHAHTKNLTVMTMDDADKPSRPAPFHPIDPLGFHHLGRIPVEWVAVPSGSADMVRVIPDRLKDHPAMVLQGHGTFVRGQTLTEALFRICLAEVSGYTARLASRMGIDPGGLRRRIETSPGGVFVPAPSPYRPWIPGSRTYSGEEEIRAAFVRTGARIFESRLSPFHTGSVSVRGVRTMLYAPYAAMPRDIGGPLLEVPLGPEKDDDGELDLHKRIYARSQFQTVLHSWVPEAEIVSRWIPPGESRPLERLVPIDAEGSFLYLVIPVLPTRFSFDDLIHLLHEYKVVIVRGGGVWGVGSQSLSEVLHHPSSVREICLYRFGAIERGLDLGKIEPEKARNW